MKKLFVVIVVMLAACVTEDASPPTPPACSSLGCTGNLLCSSTQSCVCMGEVCTPDVFVEPESCDAWEALTVDAADIGEVRVPGFLHTPGISYVAADGDSTWTYWVRRWGDRVGSYGTYEIGSTRCQWRDAIEERTPATGQR